MDHKSLIAGLTPDTRKSLLQISDMAGLAHLAWHWGLMVLLGVLIATGVPGWPLIMVIQGILIVFCFTLLHECVHRTPFATGWLNAAVFHICAFLLALPPEWFRYFHFAHHRYTNDPENDPELASPKPATRLEFWWAVTGLPVWRKHMAQLLRNATGRADDSFLPAGRKPRVKLEARIMLAGYGLTLAALIAGQTWLFWCWFAPAVLGQPFLRLYLMAEHGRCPPVSNMFENSRTMFTNWVMRRLAWNMPYHAEHHAYPNVPFHRLPDLHELTRPHLLSTSDGYIAFHKELASAGPNA
jgi:fatty acid desaturase